MLRPFVAALAASTVLAFSAPAALAQQSFPATVENCGATVTIEAQPERILMVNADDVALLAELGALDRLVARTGTPEAELFAPDVYAALDNVPLLTTENNVTGGSVLSLETILAQNPDLVLAPENAVDRQLLAEAGIPLYSPPAYCNDLSLIPGGTASFDLVYDQLETFGTLLGKSDLAADRIAALKASVAPTDAGDSHGTGFALYVAAGGKTLYPYGARSMVTPVFAAAGLDNVYADTDERVFEAGTEELLGQDPDVIVLLYSGTSPDVVLADFMSVPGVENFKAVENGHVVTLPFSFTDPPSPLSLKGAAALAEKLAALK
ncbi:ABC transporter substrate-binding protein [Devosia sp.]|uniref:ABC transporter substrate-binding protein n=1 Tax=Devosia sp. TaxID=1871048 RepID=UPI003A9331E1